MKKREIACLGIRFLSIYMILQGIIVTANVVPLLISTISQKTNENHSYYFFSCLIIIVFGVILWLVSDQLSAIIFKEEAHFEGGLGTTTKELQTVLFSLLGLFFLGNSLPKLVTILINIYVMHETPNMTLNLISGLAGVITEIVLGLVIFLKAHSLVSFLNTTKEE
ncbi:MAG TPA: hypothetical protein DCZ10_04310 [Pelotomaculum sp.]|nr:hypothetical protein [Pelotomaculum sp.]